MSRSGRASKSSKARKARGKVSVHLCQVADVSKRCGAPAGEVQLSRYESIRVYPQADEVPADQG